MSDCTNNGKTAVKMIKDKWEVKKCTQKCPGYQLVFMDCNMPIMDGFEATKILRKFMEEEIIPKISIIATTANVFDEEIQKCFKCGMDDYLAKPLTKKKLENALNMYLP